jgi:hypothetical protein
MGKNYSAKGPFTRQIWQFRLPKRTADKIEVRFACLGGLKTCRSAKSGA